jgi:hypothetical protein
MKTVRLAVIFFALAGSLSACGIDTDEVINDINNQLEDDGEIYYDPTCADEDQDGWCD